MATSECTTLSRWLLCPPEAIIHRGRLIPIPEEVGTREGARILKLSIRRMQQLCDEGALREGIDWWATPGPVGGKSGKYRIRLDSLIRLRHRPTR